MIKSCVIGHPIQHSRSPLIHEMWLSNFGIVGSYTREDVSPADLGDFFARMRNGEFVGCNVTLPHKETSLSHMDVVDARVQRTGSLNTVYVRDKKLCATSTDGEGFAANVLWHVPSFDFVDCSVLLLGAGGSARAIVDEVLRRGAAGVIIANRTLAKAAQIAQDFGRPVSAITQHDLPSILGEINLVINTTSAGIVDGNQVDLEFTMLPRTAVVADINYVPLITAFLSKAESSDLRIVPGLGMLLHQAVRGFELWFGQKPTVTQELHDLVARDINPLAQENAKR